ncbi:3-isopropylmalate dehydratase small subunit [Microbacterium sp. NPDC091382]|uniref:3-isopropylmalate dehydratase small subunit n=1 Tax=Microbacterium sp. NPDC091382 TaxID=3364210 RepID=UPI00382F0C48
MEKFTRHTGVGVPLKRSAVDTDQIIPAVYLKRVTKTGFDDALFANWRQDPAFVLNQDAYREGSVLVAGPDFGTGSSREHAVWALRDYGFRVVLSTKFADIFRGNAGKQGLVTGVVTEDVLEAMWGALEAEPGRAISVDLETRTVEVGDLRASFDIDDYTRWRLLEGLDDIGLTLRSEDQIAQFEARREAWRPRTLPVR